MERTSSAAMRKMSRKGLAQCVYRLPWNASIRMPAGYASGTTPFPPTGCRKIHGRGSFDRMRVSALQKAVSQAGRSVGLNKRISCQTFRHSVATHLLQQGDEIRTVHARLGHNDVKTTMMYTHVLTRGRLAVRSPLD